MKYLLIAFLLYFSITSLAQKVPAALATRLQGKTTIQSIMSEVEAFYQGEGKGLRAKYTSGEFEDDYLKWKRWEWWMLSHLDENGNFVDINKKNFEAANKTDQKWGSLINKDSWAPQSRKGTEGGANNKATGTENAYGAWTSIGPFDDGTTNSGDIEGLGRIDRIAFHPSNANIIYIGSPSGGVWKTTNGGTSWTAITNSLPALGVSGIAVSPTNGNVVYVLTGDGDSHMPGYLVSAYGSSGSCIGVFKTTDGGDTWTKTGDLYTGTSDFVGHRLTVSPTNGNYLIAATNQGLYRTTNGGTTWTQVKTGNHRDVKFKPTDDSVVYASSNTDVFYSTDGGRSGTWNTSTFDFPNGSVRIELAVSPDNPTWVYALCGDVPSSGTFQGLFRSTNSGVSYTRRCNTPNILGSQKNGSGSSEQSDFDMGIAVKPSDGSYVITCALNVWRSDGSNGGSTMRYATIYREGQGLASEYIHPDVHAVEYNPLNNYLYAGSDGGIYRSTDDGVSWTNLSDDVATSQFYRFAMQDTDGDGEMDGTNLLAGAQDNGIKFRSGGIYKHVICCDGFGTAIAPNNADVLYLNINDYFAKSTDGGASYSTLINSGNVPVTFFSPVAIDYNNSNNVFLGGSSTRRSINGFTSTDATVATNTRRVLVTCPSNSLRLYGSSGSNVIRSDNQIDTWTTKSGTAGWPAGTFTINDIKPLPTNSLNVYVSFGGYSDGNKVMRSTNGGDSWTNWSGSLPNVPCYGLAVASEGVYVGTEIGVFFRGYSYTDWVPFYTYMPRVAVTGLWVNEFGNIYASTFGRGMWFSSRKTDCADNITISQTNMQGPFYFEANVSASATLTSQGGAGTEIFMHAGDSVILKPGFEIQAGTFFKGYIAPCNTGGIPTTTRSNSTVISFPPVKELTAKKTPEAQTEYWRINTKGELEFYLIGKKKIDFYAKDITGEMIRFYPPEIFYPGLYSVPLPNADVEEVEIQADGKPILKYRQ